jgi:ribosomal protein L16/L10AE
MVETMKLMLSISLVRSEATWIQSHTLNDCRGFSKRSLKDRQKFLRENRICFKCCESNEHIANNCTANIKCQICGNIRHATAMHMDRS